MFDLSSKRDRLLLESGPLEARFREQPATGLASRVSKPLAALLAEEGVQEEQPAAPK